MNTVTVMLPIVDVQHDIQSVIDDVQQGIAPVEDVWISCYRKGSTSVHGKAQVSRSSHSGGVDLEPRDGVTISCTGSTTFDIECAPLSIPPTRVRLPRQSITLDVDASKLGLHNRQINAFDVSLDATRIASGLNDGRVLQQTLPSSSGSPFTSSSKPHASSVSSIRFFPSSRVLLTAGDMTLTILSAEFPANGPVEPVRVLKGHTRAVTDTAILGRGKRILSSGKDGAVRLWDVPAGSQIRRLVTSSASPVLKLASSNGEEDGVLYASLQRGSVDAIDLRTNTPSNVPIGSSSLTAVAYSDSTSLLATGSSNGIVTLVDTRNTATPLVSYSRNEASISDLTFLEDGLIVGAEDGLPYIARRDADQSVEIEELRGGDVSATRVVRCSGGIWTASDDGVVRRY